MTEFEISVRFIYHLNERPTAQDVEDDMKWALGRGTELGPPSQIVVRSILHTDEEFLKATSRPEFGCVQHEKA
jgi:hypothetical protein